MAQLRARRGRLNDRQRLVGLIDAELARINLPYHVQSIDRAYTGYWQRTEGACRWWAVCAHNDGRTAPLTILSWDTMRECATRGLEVSSGVVDWECNAKPAKEKPANAAQ